MERVRIGVIPAGARVERSRLLDALEELLPVRFVADDNALSGLVSFGEPVPGGSVPTLRLGVDEPPAEGAGTLVSLTAAGVDARLAGRDLVERRLGPARLAEEDGARLAGDPAGTLWAVRGEAQATAVAPRELAPGEPLRNRLQPSRWLALAPLVQFVRSLAGPVRWTPPPPRAAFLLDDPNLHWTSYGFLRYAEAAAAAREGNYHLALATVPIDGWFAHPRAARVFREHSAHLSLLVHGNDHAPDELARPLDRRGRRALLAQALRRIEALERRSRVSVSRVMAAPHGVCSEQMAAAMPNLGFEAITISRPYPWLARPPSDWLAAPPEAGPAVGMRPTELVAGGLPVLLRTTLDHGEDDLLLRAFLDQPLIVSGHHDDLAQGLGRLADLAASVNRIGGVRWGSLAEISRSSYVSRLEGGVMRVRPYARLLVVEPPRGVEAIAVEPLPQMGGVRLSVDGRPTAATEPVAISAGPVEVRAAPPDAIDPQGVPARRTGAWPAARRVLAEGRDRLTPVLAR